MTNYFVLYIDTRDVQPEHHEKHCKKIAARVRKDLAPDDRLTWLAVPRESYLINFNLRNNNDQ